MPLGAVTTSTVVATFSACQSSICALLAMKLYSRRGHPSDEDLSQGTPGERPEVMQAAHIGGQRGTFLGIPLSGFGLFTSLLLSFAAGFLTFFGATCIAIFVL